MKKNKKNNDKWQKNFPAACDCRHCVSMAERKTVLLSALQILVPMIVKLVIQNWHIAEKGAFNGSQD